MGVGLQLVLYMIFSTAISFLLYKLGVAHTIFVAALIMMISSIIAVKLTEIFYHKKLMKKKY